MKGLYALVLAGGSGARFGGRKLLAPYRGGRLLDRALDAALDAPVDGVLLVTGADAGEVAAAAWDVAGADPRLTLVHAAEHAEGLAASLRTGVAALPDSARGVLVFLGDMPRAPREAAAGVAAALDGGAAAAVPTFAGRRGHPVGFARAQFPALLALSGDRGGGAVLAGLGAAAVEVAVLDDGVLADVDTPEDLAALTELMRAREPPDPSTQG